MTSDPFTDFAVAYGELAKDECLTREQAVGLALAHFGPLHRFALAVFEHLRAAPPTELGFGIYLEARAQRLIPATEDEPATVEAKGAG